MKKSIIIWSIAIILVVIALFTTYQYNNKQEEAQTPPAQTNPQVVPPAGAPIGPVIKNPAVEEEVVSSIDALDFTLKDLNGKEISLSDFKGKTIYVNFWATWCGYCVEELPFIEQLHKENKDPDLVILTVDLQESQEKVGKFMSDNNYTFPVLLDEKGETSSLYGIQGIPLSILINKDFKIISAHEGYMNSLDMLKDFIDQANQ